MSCFWMTDVAFSRVNDVMPLFCLVLWPHAMFHDVMPCFKNETWCHVWQIFCFSIGKLCFNFHFWLLSFVFLPSYSQTTPLACLLFSTFVSLLFETPYWPYMIFSQGFYDNFPPYIWLDSYFRLQVVHMTIMDFYVVIAWTL